MFFVYFPLSIFDVYVYVSEKIPVPSVHLFLCGGQFRRNINFILDIERIYKYFLSAHICMKPPPSGVSSHQKNFFNRPERGAVFAAGNLMSLLSILHFVLFDN